MNCHDGHPTMENMGGYRYLKQIFSHLSSKGGFLLLRQFGPVDERRFMTLNNFCFQTRDSLLGAAKKGDVDELKRLLEKGNNPNIPRILDDLLLTASRNGHSDLVKYLA